jgi:hypothetical protein
VNSNAEAVENPISRVQRRKKRRGLFRAIFILAEEIALAPYHQRRLFASHAISQTGKISSLR